MSRARIPSIDKLLKTPDAAPLLAAYGHQPVVLALRDAAADLRTADAPEGADLCAQLLDATRIKLQAAHAPRLKPVFNLTGTILHTNLGRAVLPAAALDALARIARNPCNLEFDLESGRRGDRDSHVETWLTRLTGAEAATVVNNNAAAVMLVLNTLAKRRRVLVARGELVEIGGAFRVPEVMRAAGCKLVEVGTTNRVHLRDFQAGLTEGATIIMKVHPSNYKIEGFTASVPEAELASAAQAANATFVVDLGSGTLIDFASLGLPPEPTVQETLAQGADLVTFSGDKLLGGPQAGIIVGRRELIGRIKKNPLARALRVDKLILAALEAVLQLYTDPARAAQKIPALRAMTRPLPEIEHLAAGLLIAVRAALAGIADVDIVPCKSQIGSGALPVDLLPSVALAMTPTPATNRAVERLAQRLRGLPTPVIGRIHQGAVLLDLRTLETPSALVTELAQLSTSTQP